MLPIRCPSCNRTMTVADEAIGKRARCSKCQNVFRVEPPAQPKAVEVEPKKDTESDDRPRRKKKKRPRVYVEVQYPRWLGILSCAWALVGWALAALAPQLAFLPLVGVLHYALPAVTVALIGANLYLAVQNLWRGVHPLALLLVTGLQMGLFTTLFFQLFAHLGASLYDVQGPTSTWQWLGFSLAHALRAWDVLDVIEAFSLNVQMIRHDAWLVAVFVILYHVVVDVFFLGVVWDVVQRIKEDYLEDEVIRDFVRKVLIAAFALWFVAWIVTAGVRRWPLIDVPLWFVENVLRVFDFADVMESFDLSLHRLPREGLTGVLTFFCRLWVAIGIGLVLGRKKKAAERRIATPPEADALRYWSARAGVLAAGLIVVLATGLLWQVVLAGAVPSLAEAAGGQSEERATAALAALRRMGPTAQAAVPALAAARKTTTEMTRDDITRTLGYLGTQAIDPLADIALGEGEEPAMLAVRSLGRIRPEAAPALAKVWSATPSEAVRQEAATELKRFGSDAVPPLMAATTRENAEAHYHWFAELDRNWTLRSTSNKVAKALQKLPEMLQELKNGPDAATTVKILDGLKDCGSAAREALPAALDGIGARDGRVQDAAAAFLTSFGPAATPELLRRLDLTAQRWDGPVFRVLTPEGMWNEAVLKEPRAFPVLMQLLNRQETPIDTRMTAVHFLALVGPSAKDAVPGLLPLLGADLPKNRALVREALARVDPEWNKRSYARAAIIDLFPRLAGLPAAESEELLAILGDLQESDAVPLFRLLLAEVPPNEEDRYRDTVRNPVFAVLDRLGPKVRGAASALGRAVPYSKAPWQVRLRLIESLKKITSPEKIASEIGPLVPAVLASVGAGGEGILFLKEGFPTTRDCLGKVLEDKDLQWRRCAVQAVYALQAANLLRDEDKSFYLPKVMALLLDEGVIMDLGIPMTRPKAGRSRTGAFDVELARDAPAVSGNVPSRGFVVDTLNELDSNWAQNEAARTVFPALAANIKSEPSQNRGLLLRVLSDAGPAARPAIPALAKLFTPKNGPVLMNVDFPDQLRKVLDQIDPDWRKLPVIREIAPAESAVTTATDTASKEVVAAITAVLTEVVNPRLTRQQTAYLMASLSATDPKWAAQPKAKEMIPAVLAEVAGQRGSAARYAVLCAAIGPGAVPEVLKLLDSDKAEQRGLALVALGAIGPGAKEALPAIAKALKDRDAKVRQGAVDAVGKVGKGDRELIALLGPCLVDDDTAVPSAALGALKALAPDWEKAPKFKEALAPVLKNLSSNDPKTRARSLWVLEQIGPADGVVPALEQLLKGEDDPGNQRRAQALLDKCRRAPK